jgi:hypothetical protein
MNPERKEKCRAFKEALRARLRSVAAERGVAAADMKWLGRLRHADLVAFVERHNLNWDWVLSPPETAARRPALRVINGGLQ